MTAAAHVVSDLGRAALVRRGQKLSLITIGYNIVEGVVAEVASGVASLWRLRADVDPVRRERVEHVTVRIVGASFLVLAAFVTIDAVNALLHREHPDESYFGIALAIGSLVVMPILARAKRRVAAGLSSRALASDATQTDVCTYLSAILLGGLALNAAFGWWWADPVAALAMIPFIVKEGIEGVRGEPPCADCA